MASTSGSEGEFSKDTASFTREYCTGNRGWIRKSMLYIFLEGKHVTDISFIAGMLHLSQDSKLKCPEPTSIIVGGCQDNWNMNVRVFANNQEIILNKL